jgi:hypothetical protein
MRYAGPYAALVLFALVAAFILVHVARGPGDE